MSRGPKERCLYGTLLRVSFRCKLFIPRKSVLIWKLHEIAAGRALEAVGYVMIRQKRSHVRLRHQGSPTHTITPATRPAKDWHPSRNSHRGCAQAINSLVGRL